MATKTASTISSIAGKTKKEISTSATAATTATPIASKVELMDVSADKAADKANANDTNPTEEKKAKQPPPPKKEPVETFYCSVCSLTLNAKCQYDQHLTGAKHKRKEEGRSGVPKAPQKRTATGANANVTSSTGQKVSAPAITPVTTTGKTPVSTPVSTPSSLPASSANPVGQAIVDNAMGKLQKKRRVDIFCDVCKVECNSQVHADAHFSGQKHAKKLKLTGMTETPPEGTTATPNHPPTAMFYCNFCNIHLNSNAQMEAHRSGEKHQKAMQTSRATVKSGRGARFNPNVRRFQQPQNKRGDILCKVCEVEFKTFPELQKHLTSLVHKERLRETTLGSYFVSPQRSNTSPRGRGQVFGNGTSYSRSYNNNNNSSYNDNSSYSQPSSSYGQSTVSRYSPPPYTAPSNEVRYGSYGQALYPPPSFTNPSPGY